MTLFSTNQPALLFPRQHLLRCGRGGVRFISLIALLLIVLPLVATTGIALAELPQDQVPKRSRVVTYEPAESITGSVAAERLNPVPQRSRTVIYEPAKPQTSVVAHSVARPITETPSPVTSATSGTSPLGSRRSDDRYGRLTVGELLSLPFGDPEGPVDGAARDGLNKIDQMSIVANSGNTTSQPGANNNTPSPGDGNGASSQGNTTGMIVADDVFQRNGNWYAMKDGKLLPLIEYRGRYYEVDNQGNAQQEVIDPNADTTAGETEDGASAAAASSPSDQARNAVLLIVTTISILAALSVGFLAFDYKHRWEQEIVNQNSRLLGNSGTSGVFAEHDTFEPDTLSFSNDYGSLGTSFDDHSFRTIA